MRRATAPRVVLTTTALLVAVAALALWALVGSRSAGAEGLPRPAVRDPSTMIYTAPSDIFFDVDSSVLRAEAVPALEAMVADIDRSHLAGAIRVEGYTDGQGSETYNLVLSRRRAETVQGWLTKAGIDSARIHVIAYGEAYPAQPNDSDAHLQANRRVVIAVER